MNAPAAVNWRKPILLYSMMLMLAGLLFSRWLLSSALIVFVLAALLHKNFSQQFKEFFSSPLLWSMTLLFFIPLLSGMWSEHLAHWSRIMRIKLPLLFLPLCFAGMKDFQSRDWEKIAWIFSGLVIIGCAWSIFHYLQDVTTVHEGYLRSHTILTPLNNDHVRFSLLVALAIFTCMFLLVTKTSQYPKPRKYILAGAIALFVVYLHVLAVRTGLLSFYLALIIFAGWMLWNRRRLLRSIALLLVILALPVISYFALPTFKNRIRYFNYDISFVKKNVYLPGSNDGTRIISIKAGWDIQNQHACSGVGFGDVETEMNKWYGVHYPGMIEEDRILPSNEWLMYGASCGWAGFILFSIAIFTPFFTPLRKNVFWWMINIAILLTYLFDNGLEGQLSVFVHAFILLWWFKWLTFTKKEN